MLRAIVHSVMSGSCFNTATNELYTWQPSPTSSWIKYPKAFDQISGCAAPAYTPTARQSTFAVNSCTPKPELYQYTGSSWACLNCYTDYVAGTGIDITGSTISNTGDLSSTNELNTSFSVSGSNLALTDAGGTINVPVSSIAPVQAVSAGTGISISGTTTRAITNTGDLSATNEIQTLSLSGSDLSLSLGGGTVMLPGAAYLYNNGDCDPPGIVPDDQLGPFLAWNQDCEEQWTWNGSAWVLSGSPSGSFFTSSEFTGDGDISTPLTLAQQGATTGQVLRWNGTQWAPSAGGGISEPLNQVVYGTGTGVDSKPQFAINSDTLNLTGNIIVRPSVKSSTQFYPYSIWPQKNLSTDGYMGVLRIPMDSFAYRANSDPLHGNFPSWIQSFSWDNSINVPAGNPVDTTGNLIMNQGFNYDEADPTYNPKFPKFYWSTEMKYRAGTNSKSWVESHWEFVDTLGRVNRPITMAYAYDGSYADVTLTSEYKSYLKGSAQKALTPLIPYWETTDFTTGVS